MQATQKLPQLTEEERSRVEKIYEDYNSLMYRTACGLTGSREDAGGSGAGLPDLPDAAH